MEELKLEYSASFFSSTDLSRGDSSTQTGSTFDGDEPSIISESDLDIMI